MEEVKKGTVCFLKKENKVMLVRIHYGENDEKWNGVGGVVNIGEKPEDAVVREISEEIGILVDKKNLKQITVRTYPELELHVFSVDKWKGEPQLLDKTLKEIKWFDKGDLPYDKMWPDNKDWLPKVLDT